MNDRHIGRFTIDFDLIDRDPQTAREVLADLIVIRAEALWHKRCIEYVAIGDGFDELHDHGVEPPLYVAIMRTETVDVADPNAPEPDMQPVTFFDHWERAAPLIGIHGGAVANIKFEPTRSDTEHGGRLG